MRKGQKRSAGWEKVAGWYDKLTGEQGHYFHKEIIIPNVLRILKQAKAKKVLDLACGQGVLSRKLPTEVVYCGVDISTSLIRQAKQRSMSKLHSFHVADVASEKFSLQENDFDAATIILALQDIQDPKTLFQNVGRHLAKSGHLMIVMNHPCFRIPRQTSWHVDEDHLMQSRQIRGYMSSFEIPISVHPGKGKESQKVTYYHHPLSYYSKLLAQAGCCILTIEEWISNKQSTGGKAKMENRARKEIPLFMCLHCQKM